MQMMRLSNIVRSEGDPKIVSPGPSALRGADRLARCLGWFSLSLGLVELFAPRRLARAVGLEGNESLVRAYGVREIGAGVLTLSLDKRAGLWSRVAGDGLDVVTLASCLRRDNPKERNATAALLIVAGVTILDFLAAQAISAKHSRGRGQRRLYTDRSGFPRGIEAAKEAAKSFQGKGFRGQGFQAKSFQTAQDRSPV